MDGVTLLESARSAGLTVRTDGDLLVIRGPRAAEALARAVLERKPEVQSVLLAERAARVARKHLPPVVADPSLTLGPCRCCGRAEWWRTGECDRWNWTCGRCHPPAQPSQVEWFQPTSQGRPS